MNLALPGGNDDPSWLTAGVVVAGYAVVLAVILAVLFVLPYLVWTALG
jgi:hypothetical protein